MDTLRAWSEHVVSELGLTPGADYRDTVLEMTRTVAHAVARPAAPLTAYLLGVAVGQGYDLAETAERVKTLASEWAEPEGG